jgi:hypothetical protein
MRTKTLDQAVAKAKLLSAADQERIAQQLDRYVDELAALREKINQGVRSLGAGLGRELDIENLIDRANAGHAE